MGFEEEHKEAVSKRMAEMLMNGKKESTIREYLHWCGWGVCDTENIIKKALRIANKE